LVGDSAAADTCSAPASGVNPRTQGDAFQAARDRGHLVVHGRRLSQVDTFDPKPALTKFAGEPIDGRVKGDVIVRQGFPGPLMPSPFAFKKHGQSGIEIAEIFPFTQPARR
jgi:hypothetical protein